MNESRIVLFSLRAIYFFLTASSPPVCWTSRRQSAFAAGATKSDGACVWMYICGVLLWESRMQLLNLRSRNSVKDSFSQRSQTGFARLTINRTAAQPEYTHVTFPNTDLYCSHAHNIQHRYIQRWPRVYIVRKRFGWARHLPAQVFYDKRVQINTKPHTWSEIIQ
jgi:hypothetical protein